MRILFISASPLNKEVSIGNTFLNLFEDVENVQLASICTRMGNPTPPISACMCITEKMIIKNLLKNTPVGSTVEVKKIVSQPRVNDAVRFVKRYRWTIFYWLQDIVWSLGRWKSRELKKFISDFNPDIIFTVFSNSIYLHNLILHVKSISKAKLVLYAWDDYYSVKRFMISPLRWIKHFIDRGSMRRLVEQADIFYVISDIQKE